MPALAQSLAGDDDVARSALELRRTREGLHEDVDLAAAREADAPGLVVRDAVGDDGRGLAGEDRLRALGHVRLDTATGDRAEHAAGARDRELRAERARGAAPRGDDGRKRDGLTGGAPLLCLREHVVHTAMMLAMSRLDEVLAQVDT